MNRSAPQLREVPDVLIVEDESVARRALSHLLSASGYKPEAYGSAEDALRGVDGHLPPPVALVDVDLPGMSGLELVAELEKMRPGVRAVLITAAEGERIENFRRLHPVAYLRKPLDFSKLLDWLDRAERVN